MKKYIINILLCLPLLWLTASCVDDFPYQDYVIGPGEAIIDVELDYHPMIATENIGGRSAGDALNDIDDLTVFIYDVRGEIFDIVPTDSLVNLKINQKDKPGANTDMPNDAGGDPLRAESTTSRATFQINGVPFGRYYMYAVANMGPIKDTPETRKKFFTPELLQREKVIWQTGNVPANDQMFGYFTHNGTDTNVSAGFDGGVLMVNRTQVSMHCWLKRCASKVTVAYDGSGLHEGVWIYIKDVTIRDIPLACYIGRNNTVANKDSLINEGESISYNSDGALAPGQKPSSDYNDWLEITRSYGVKGAVTVNAEGDTIAHGEYERALYFYENMQGDYKDAKNKEYYDKKQDWNNVGYTPREGQYDYKDNVPLGTYIEVHAYYMSTNVNQVSEGDIIYRYMLGQNDDYNYDAIRNHHYKLTLGFRGYANQPDWHIVYDEPDDDFLIDPTYYVSYSYNTRGIFPIRFIGDLTEFEVEIVENNWAPYAEKLDGAGKLIDSVPPASVGTGNMRFQWYRDVYDGNTDDPLHYYSLQNPWSSDGSRQLTDAEAEAQKATQPVKVTPIWAGFLALQVPDGSLDAAIIVAQGKGSYYSGSGANTTLQNQNPTRTQPDKLKDYFYGKGNGNNIPQNIRKFTKDDLSFPGWKAGMRIEKTVGSGNNECKIVRDADGSTTIQLPMWTRPKSMLGISGFTGNNPYEAYQRRAMVRLKATFNKADGTGTIVRNRLTPVYQVRRLLNPKGVWRYYNDDQKFHVALMALNDPNDTRYEEFKSQGAWRAKIRNTKNFNNFIKLTGGVAVDSTGAILGSTGSFVEFDIEFNGLGKTENSDCAIVDVEYHGFTCSHSIYVRQGFYEPLDIVGDGTKWSSFLLYKTALQTHSSNPYLQWNASTKNYQDAELTSSPLAMGTYFKRANIAEGILADNNGETGLGALDPPGSRLMHLSNGNQKAWTQIDGYSYTSNSGNATNDAARKNYEWPRFAVEYINPETEEKSTRHYRLPTYAEFNRFITQAEFGIGVLYATGTSRTLHKLGDAFGFTDFANDGTDDNPTETGECSGMRGFIVYNPGNANQVFFPVGQSGIGRRTIQDATGDNLGVLRYGAMETQIKGSKTQCFNYYRPITYNLPASEGAIYWMAKAYNDNMGWDMNFFDLNFNAYDYAMGFWGGGDAVPIKLVSDD